ncbi:hypothetical protein P879_10058 [Paragonimus westermani]|uniref:RRM domain-containing protein n=1 Tax=Paragonimus westermani TaxID=34504 RepID=A0A8T0DB24_9TREM|nr:hypothetical protein P879_10058 [Paragonimus westermani]
MVTLASGTGNKLSPIQGFRVEVRNLQPSVSLDDVYELFSSIGTLRLCNLVRPGHAQVVFNDLPDANEAVRRYNGRELDGRPMSVNLVTQLPSGMGTAVRFASRLGPVAAPGAVSFQSAGALTNKWRQGDSPAKLLHTGLGGSKGKSTMEIDMDVVRKALFNVSSGSTARKPVDFNVSLR